MNIRTLVLCDDRWHPGAVVRRGLKALGDCGFDFEWLENGADWSAKRMEEFPLVVLAKSNVVSAKDKRARLTKELQFCNHIRRGSGLVGIHSGTAGYAELPAMRCVIGGTFSHHPPHFSTAVYTIQLTFPIWFHAHDKRRPFS